MALGRRRHSGFTLIELMIVVGIIGILAAVAVPSFMKYLRKGRTTEAKIFVKKLFDGARTYYSDPVFYDAKHAQALPAQFPSVVVDSYADSACCASGGANEKCDPGAEDWTGEPWQALKFAMADPHYYAYGYDVDGDEFTGYYAYAYGDLDCDGNFSTFSMYGYVGAEGSASGTATIAAINDTE